MCSQDIGTNARSSFPGNDHGLVKYTAEVDHPSEVDLCDGSSRQITGAAEATVGMKVTRSGSTTRGAFFQPVTEALSGTGAQTG